MSREEKDAHTLAYLKRGIRKENSTLLAAQQDNPKGTESEERDWGHVTVASDAPDMASETIMSTEVLDSYFDADDELPSREKREQTDPTTAATSSEDRGEPGTGHAYALGSWTECCDAACHTHLTEKQQARRFPHGYWDANDSETNNPKVEGPPFVK